MVRPAHRAGLDSRSAMSLPVPCGHMNVNPPSGSLAIWSATCLRNTDLPEPETPMTAACPRRSWARNSTVFIAAPFRWRSPRAARGSWCAALAPARAH